MSCLLYTSIFLSNLEERSDVHFFDRIGKQFIPTQAGKIYLEHARKMINIRDDYEDELKKYIHGSSGTIRFGIHPRRTLYLLSQVLPRFSARYPDVELIPYEAVSYTHLDVYKRQDVVYCTPNRLPLQLPVAYKPGIGSKSRFKTC